MFEGVALKTPELPRLPAGKTDRFFKMSLTTRQQTHEIRKSREIHQQKYGGKITTKKMGGFRPSPNHFFGPMVAPEHLRWPSFTIQALNRMNHRKISGEILNLC